MIRYATGALVLLTLSILTVADHHSDGTRWAVLVAGSDGYYNYRHQADVCHAYQLLRKGGLKDENIIIFMSDDIADNPENPRPGVIINSPRGEDVYKGVPKDYVGNDVTAQNFYAVLLGNKTAVTGGSGKVVDSGPNDHIFVYYTDHGGPGILGMPVGEFITANDLNNVLKKKHASGTYKSLVFYLEACDSGSMFEGLLPEGLNIYATTAANATEDSWATYCDLEGYDGVCLGDTYSISWLEDSDTHNSETQTLMQQYKRVKKRTAKGNIYGSSHVMQYGDINLSVETLSTYMGVNTETTDHINFTLQYPILPINQRDADLVHFWHKFRNAPQGSTKKSEARKQLAQIMSHRMHVDSSVDLIGKLLFGNDKGPQTMTSVRPAGRPVVDDWDCLKSVVRTFETYCGSLSQYGMKHMRSFANICNANVKTEQMAKASAQACTVFPSNPWSSLNGGFST